MEIYKGSENQGAHIADYETQNQGVSTINRKRERLIDAGSGDDSMVEIGNRIKYIRDTNGTSQSNIVIGGSVPPNPSCLYSTVNS